MLYFTVRLIRAIASLFVEMRKKVWFSNVEPTTINETPFFYNYYFFKKFHPPALNCLFLLSVRHCKCRRWSMDCWHRVSVLDKCQHFGRTCCLRFLNTSFLRNDVVQRKDCCALQTSRQFCYNFAVFHLPLMIGVFQKRNLPFSENRL